MPFKVGPWELILVLAIILIIFGVGKLPQIGGAIGKGLREFRKGAKGEFTEEPEEPAQTNKAEITKSDTSATTKETPSKARNKKQ